MSARAKRSGTKGRRDVLHIVYLVPLQTREVRVGLTTDLERETPSAPGALRQLRVFKDWH